VNCLKALGTASYNSASCPQVDALILDGAAIVNFLNPNNCKTFAAYAQDVFVKYVISQLLNVRRVDVVQLGYIFRG